MNHRQQQRRQQQQQQPKPQQHQSHQHRILQSMKQLRQERPHEIMKMIPPMLIEKSISEQIVRCLDRMKPYPHTIDTILRILQTLSANPHNIKYRTIPNNNISQTHLQNIPGAITFLSVMGYQSTTNDTTILLRLQRYDPILIQKGTQEIQHVQRTSTEYQNEKQWYRFHKQMQDIWQKVRLNQNHDDTTTANTTATTVDTTSATTSMNQMIDDTNTILLLSSSSLPLPPPVPKEQYGCSFIQIQLGKMDSTMTIRRMFRSDDTLADLYHWMAHTLGSIVWNQLHDHQWYIVNQSKSSGTNTDFDLHGSSSILPSYHPERSKYMTLQSLGLWPSGKLQIRPHMVTVASSPAIIHHLEEETTTPLPQQQHRPTVAVSVCSSS